MEGKKKAAPGGSGLHNSELYSTDLYDKDSEYFPKRQVRLLFLAGHKLTAREINRVVGFNDARKVISVLRREGMRIKDVVLRNRCKLYWLEPDNEPKLF